MRAPGRLPGLGRLLLRRRRGGSYSCEHQDSMEAEQEIKMTFGLISSRPVSLKATLQKSQRTYCDLRAGHAFAWKLGLVGNWHFHSTFVNRISVAKKWSRETMAFQQACTRCGLVFLVLSLQAALLRAEEAQPKAVPAPSASPSSAAPPPQARQTPPDTSGLRSQALLASIDKILKRVAAEREEAKTLPYTRQVPVRPRLDSNAGGARKGSPRTARRRARRRNGCPDPEASRRHPQTAGQNRRQPGPHRNAPREAAGSSTTRAAAQLFHRNDRSSSTSRLRRSRRISSSAKPVSFASNRRSAKRLLLRE